MRSTRLSVSQISSAPLSEASARTRPASASADVMNGSNQPYQPPLQQQNPADVHTERRHGGDRRAQSRREERQNVWLDTRSGQDRRRQNRRAGDSLSTVSLKI